MGGKWKALTSLRLGLSFLALFVPAISPPLRAAPASFHLNPNLYKEYLDLLKLRPQNKPDMILEGMQRIIQKDPTFWRAYQKVAEVYKMRNDAEGAEAYFQSLLEADPENLYAYYGLGMVYRAIKKDPAAWLANFKRCVDQAPGFVLIYATYWEALGNGVGEFPAIVIDELNKSGNNAAAQYGIGLIQERHGQPREAIETLDRSIALSPNLIEAYMAKATIHASRGDLPELLNVSLRGLDLAKELSDWEYRESFLEFLARAYYGLADYGHALEYSNQALDLARALGDVQAEQRRLGGLGILYTEFNNYTTALKYLEQALDISRQIGSKDSERIHLGNIGRLYSRLGQYAPALKYLNEAAALAKKIGNKPGLAFHLTNIGFTYISSGEIDQAIDSLSQAAKLVENRRLEGYISLYLGHAEALRGSPKALDHLQRALKIAEEIGERKLEGLALNYLGSTLQTKGRYSEAIKYHTQALQIGEQKGIAWVIWEAQAGLGAVYEKQRAFPQALAAYKRAVDAIESVRAGNANLEDDQKVSFLSGKMEVYERLNGLLAKLHRMDPSQGYDKLAFHYAERAKARSMLDILQKDKADLKEDPIDVRAAQAQLDEKTVLLEYFLSKHQSLLFAVTNRDFQMFPLSGRAIEELAGKFADSAQEPANHSAYLAYVLTASRLYDRLVRPAEGLLKGKSRLVIVADGRLHYIPFAALLDRKVAVHGDVDFTKLPYLIRRYSVRYAHSASVLKVLNESRPASLSRSGFLGISASPQGNSLATRGYAGGALYSNLEVAKIARLYKSNSVVADPTSASLLAQMGTADYKGIHFAVCGLLSGQNPRLDLNCSEGQKQGRFLNLNDILKLRLNTDLVVLSACQTGLGRDVKGEGVLGFSRAFIHAGASSVMVTLWRISDHTTPELMLRFYRHWADSKKAEALRLASLEMIKSKYAHPFYWAGFVLLGAEPR